MDPVQAFMQANALATPLFPPTSRYYGIATAQLTAPDGTVITYLKRRFVPPPENFSTLAEHLVVSGDRLDNLAARYLGDPQQYWRICDANAAMSPTELTETVGNYLRITLPEGIPGGNDAG
jgi:hypothetical protein